MFVTNARDDTVAVERYTRTASRWRGTTCRDSRARVSFTTLPISPPDGGCVQCRIRRRALVPMLPATLTTTTITTALRPSRCSAAEWRIPLEAGSEPFGEAIGRFPGIPSSAAIYEQMLIAARPAAGDSAVLVLLSPGPSCTTVSIMRRSPTGYTYRSTFFGGWTEQVVADPSAMSCRSMPRGYDSGNGYATSQKPRLRSPAAGLDHPATSGGIQAQRRRPTLSVQRSAQRHRSRL